MSDRSELLKDFADAAGRLTEYALSQLSADDQKALATAIDDGTGSLRLSVQLSPHLVVSGGLFAKDRRVPPVPLFRIGDPGPQDEDWN